MSSEFRPWDVAWHEALYGANGFYRQSVGPAGHFATSAQGIPGVDVVLANAVLALADQAGADVIVDFACGRGELLRCAAELMAQQPRRLVGVDVVERPNDLPRDIEWVRSPGGAHVPAAQLGEALRGQRALVVAHEWLDVVPVPVAEVDSEGVWREVLVARDGEEKLGEKVPGEEVLGEPLSQVGRDFSARHKYVLMSGQRIERGQAREAAWTDLVEAVRANCAPGSLVVGVDYVFTRDNLPPLGTLTGFADGMQTTPIPDGSCDITSHVDIDGLDIDSYVTQRELLLDLFGTEALQPVPVELARTQPSEYMARLSARSAFAAATASDGLGGFAWWFKQL